MKNDEQVKTMFNQDIISCHQLLRFWITWSDDTIQVGRGLMGEGLLLSWTDETEDGFIPVSSVSLGSGGDGVMAEWVIPKKQGLSLQIVITDL